MDRAYLGADYHDAGANRVVSVLEELQDGFLAKSVQYREVAKADRLNDHEAGWAVNLAKAKLLETLIDDIALFIQREQRNGR